jgi:trimethylamine:corrinoid methyltransferase-like protein
MGTMACLLASFAVAGAAKPFFDAGASSQERD